MKISRIFYLLLSFVLAFFFIGPFIYVSKFTFLTADDYCRSFLEFKDIATNIKEWYLLLNGRFVNSFFSFLPIYDLTLYRTVISLNFVFLGLGLFWFLNRLLLLYKIEINLVKKIFLTLLIYSFWLAQIPTLFEFFYWYAAATAYLYSFIFLMLFIGFLLSFYFQKKVNLYLIALLIILINGNNEILMGLTNFILLVLLGVNLWRNKKWNITLIILNVISWLSSLLVILSPGTIHRREQFDYGGNFFSSVKVAIIYGTKFIAKIFIEFPFIIFSIVIFYFVFRSLKNKTYPSIHPLILAGISYLSVLSICFIVFYATGSSVQKIGRIGNITVMVIQLFVIVNLFNLAVYLKTFTRLRVKFPSFTFSILLLFFLTYIFLKNKNYETLREDLGQNRLEKYYYEREERINFLKMTDEDSIIFKPIKNSLLLNSGDYLLSHEIWFQECYRDHFNARFSKKIKHIEVDYR